MSSQSLKDWSQERLGRLDEIEAALQAVAGVGRGRRFTTQQLNRAYAVLVSAQFQSFCADLHAECVDATLLSIGPPINLIAKSNFLHGRQLDRGNAQSGSMGSDFGRLGIEFWPALRRHNALNDTRKTRIDELNAWRNAIVHDDFSNTQKFPAGRNTILRLDLVRKWRVSRDNVAKCMDAVLRNYVQGLTGASPW